MHKDSKREGEKKFINSNEILWLPINCTDAGSTAMEPPARIRKVKPVYTPTWPLSTWPYCPLAFTTHQTYLFLYSQRKGTWVELSRSDMQDEACEGNGFKHMCTWTKANFVTNNRGDTRLLLCLFSLEVTFTLRIIQECSNASQLLC